MKKFIKNIIKTRTGTTLLEILTALIILAFTFLPIIVTIGTSTRDTDVQNSYVFAQTTARNILDTLLDDIPFGCIKEGSDHIAELVVSPYNKDYNLDPFKEMIGISGKSRADGTIIDERGAKYNVKIYVWSIFANTNKNHLPDQEMLFSYLPRPDYENASSTKQDGVIENLWYTYDSTYAAMFMRSDKDPYSDKDYPVKRIEKNAFELGAKKYTNSGGYCVMKKILLKIQWFATDKKERNMEIYTMKANLDSER